MAKSKNSLKFEFFKGIWQENSVLKQLLGMCPTLAVTTSSLNGFTMGLATSFVLISSSVVISVFRKIIPNQVRIPVFTITIAAFVTVADLFLAAEYPKLSQALGPYVPLIIVNCMILGRQEVFASKNGVFRSIIDAMGMGAGFIIVLVILGSIREILGSGSIFNFPVISGFNNWVIMVLPAGAFLSLGCLVALVNYISKKQKNFKIL